MRNECFRVKKSCKKCWKRRDLATLRVKSTFETEQTTFNIIFIEKSIFFFREKLFSALAMYVSNRFWEESGIETKFSGETTRFQTVLCGSGKETVAGPIA